jgi:hypothetical protein
MNSNVNNPSFGMNTDGIIKIGRCEHTMYSSGDVFCSLTPEELEAERQEARLQYEKWQELVLLEQASKMSLMDFFVKWQKWNVEREEYESYRSRLFKHSDEWKEDWNDYQYRMNTYDREKATEAKINKWRKYRMVSQHLWATVLGIAAYLAWSTSESIFWSGLLGMLCVLNVLDIGFNWTTYKKRKIWQMI